MICAEEDQFSFPKERPYWRDQVTRATSFSMIR